MAERALGRPALSLWPISEPVRAVWADLHSMRASLVEILDGMSQAGLARAFPLPWARRARPTSGSAPTWPTTPIPHSDCPLASLADN